MQDPAQLMSDEWLERSIVEGIADATDENIQQMLDTWVPKGSHDYLMQQLGARNLTAEKIQGLVPRVEGLLLGYLSALIRGFLQPKEESNYLASSSLGESERIQFPVHTIDETYELTAWLVLQRDEFYQRRLAQHQDNRNFQLLVDAASVNFAENKKPVYPFTKLLWERGWLPLQVRPEIFKHPQWLKQSPREKAKSIAAHIMRVNPEPADYLHAKDGPERAVSDFEAELIAAEEATMVATSLSQLVQQWQTERDRFLTEASDQVVQAEPESKSEIAQQLCAGFVKLCSDQAGLEADRLYVKRMRCLHNHWLLSPIEKIEKFVKERFTDQVIVCNRVVEVLYHLELLVANLYEYVIRMMSDPELSTPLLVHAGRVSESGDVVALTEEEKARHGLFLALVLHPRLEGLLGKLRFVNYAEAKRAQVEKELTIVLKEIEIHLVKLIREAEALPYRTLAAVQEGGHNYEVKETDQPDGDGIKLGQSRQLRLAKLAELALGQTSSDSVKQFDQLLPLYAETAVSAGKLSELFHFGIGDVSLILHLLVKNSRLSDPIAAVSHLLVAHANIEYKKMGVSTLTWAYEAFKHANTDEAKKALCLRVYALLRAVNQLSLVRASSEAEELGSGVEEGVIPRDWFSQTAFAILQAVSHKSGVSVDLYWRRDKLFLVAMLKRLVTHLYFEMADTVGRKVLDNNEILGFILSSWNYLSVSVRTMQLFADEHNSVELSGLHTAIASVVRVALIPSRKKGQREGSYSLKWEEIIEQRDKLLAPVDTSLVLEDQMQHRGLSWGEIITFQKEMAAYERAQALAKQKKAIASFFVGSLDPTLLLEVARQLQASGLPQQDEQAAPAQPVGLIAGLGLLMQQQSAAKARRAVSPAAGGGGGK
jgi:hypothetical protein